MITASNPTKGKSTSASKKPSAKARDAAKTTLKGVSFQRHSKMDGY